MLTPEEMRRNQRGDDRLYISVKHESYNSLVDLYRIGMDEGNEVSVLGLCGVTRGSRRCSLKRRALTHL